MPAANESPRDVLAPLLRRLLLATMWSNISELSRGHLGVDGSLQDITAEEAHALTLLVNETA